MSNAYNRPTCLGFEYQNNQGNYKFSGERFGLGLARAIPLFTLFHDIFYKGLTTEEGFKGIGRKFFGIDAIKKSKSFFDIARLVYRIATNILKVIGLGIIPFAIDCAVSLGRHSYQSIMQQLQVKPQTKKL
ncbi:hypothetical protein N9Y92_01135 [Chlamydiales bacterium]|nr:hypothetical protein [Chlamydiales bacterium]